MSYIEESIYVAYILEDNEIVIELEDNVEDANSTWLIYNKKVIGYIVVNGYEDADEEEILKAFHTGYKNIKDFFDNNTEYVVYDRDRKVLTTNRREGIEEAMKVVGGVNYGTLEKWINNRRIVAWRIACNRVLNDPIFKR